MERQRSCRRRRYVMMALTNFSGQFTIPLQVKRKWTLRRVGSCPAVAQVAATAAPYCLDQYWLALVAAGNFAVAERAAAVGAEEAAERFAAVDLLVGVPAVVGSALSAASAVKLSGERLVVAVAASAARAAAECFHSQCHYCY